jgi:hypothetical protein
VKRKIGNILSHRTVYICNRLLLGIVGRALHAFNFNTYCVVIPEISTCFGRLLPSLTRHTDMATSLIKRHQLICIAVPIDKEMYRLALTRHLLNKLIHSARIKLRGLMQDKSLWAARTHGGFVSESAHE